LENSLSFDTYLLAFAAFLIAGFVKGVIGMGMPTVSLAVLSIAMGLPTAIQLVVVPTFATNVWQALVGDGFRRLVRRFWLLLVTTVLGVWIGNLLLFRTNSQLMTAVLGIAICVYSASALIGFPLVPRVRREQVASPLIGIATGILAGSTGNIAMPAIAYFQRLGLPRDDLVQMLGILFSLGSAALGFALAKHGGYASEHLLLSTACVLPGIVGMVLGRTVRRKLSEIAFRRALFVGLLVAGAHLMIKGLT
jgi:uncharacterized membrane protein YfcA